MSDINDYKTPNPEFEPNRQRVDIQVDSLVQAGESVYRISQVLDFESVIGVEVESGRSTPLRMGELRPVANASTSTRTYQELADIADEDWRCHKSQF